jgi:hypothetical protein
MPRHFVWIFGGAIGASVALGSPVAFAQAAVPEQSPAVAIPPDVIVLKDGSRYRGTITELIKNGPITIVLMTGEVRKLLSEEVAYAGPAASEPAVAPDRAAAAQVVTPRAPPSADEAEAQKSKPVRIRFSANRVGSEFFVRQSASKFRRVCTAPCAHDFEPAVYGIGVRFDKNAKVKPLQDVMLDEPSTLQVDYRSRASLRGVGGAVLAIGATLGIGCATYLLTAERSDKAWGYLGLTTGVAGAITGFSLMLVGDRVVLSVK